LVVGKWFWPSCHFSNKVLSKLVGYPCSGCWARRKLQALAGVLCAHDVEY
jgi:hypothetical protein